jgi:TonB family protein
VRFLDARPEYRVQIQEWVRSQTPPPAAWEESSILEADGAGSPPKQETNQELRTDKRISLVPEIAEPGLSRQEPPEVSGNGMRQEVQTDRTDPASAQIDELASQPFVEPANSLPVEFRAIQDGAAQDAAIQNASAQTRDEPEGGDFPITAPSHDKSENESTLGWPTPISRTAELAIPRSQVARSDAVDLFTSAADSKTKSTPTTVNTIFDIPEPTNKVPTRNRYAIAVLLVLCSVLCFAIGTWIGQIVTRRNLSKTAAAAVNLVRIPDAGIKGSVAGSAGKPESATSERVHTGAASGHRALDARKAEPAKDSLDVVPARQSTQPDPQEQTVAAPATAKEQENSPPAAIAKENSAAPGQNAAPFAATKGQESNPAVAPAPENSVAAAPSPRIVAGLVLKPSDRFNPCYLAYRVEAEYPPEAQKQRIEGVVKIQQVVGVDGKVRSVKLLSGPPLLVPAALEAARYWRYLPALLNGQPVETEQDVEIAFQLPN